MINITPVALIGFGLSGRCFHAPFLKVHPGFEVKKVMQKTGSDALGFFPDAVLVRSIDEIAKDPDIDLAVITVPNVYHFPYGKALLEGGKNIVMEKPFAPHSGEVKQLAELAAGHRLKIFPYHNRRWDADFLTIRKILSSGMLGRIEYYEAHFDRYAPERQRAFWRDEPLPGSGVLYDLGPHLIDQALVLFGPPEAVKADIRREREGSEVDDYFRLQLRYPDKEVVLRAGMLVVEPGPRYIIHGERGSLIKYGIDPQEEKLRNGALPDEEGWGEEPPELWPLITIDWDDLQFDGRIESVSGNYMAFYDNVYDSLHGKAEPAVNWTDAWLTIRIIELAFESVVAGKVWRKLEKSSISFQYSN
ncbi:MAG: Gfo/Idh/MocA family oxidoreductase [Bacteroidales bacterium]